MRRITTVYPFCLFWLENSRLNCPDGLVRQAYLEGWWDEFRKPLPIDKDRRTGTELDFYEGLFRVHPMREGFQQAMTNAYEMFICHLVATGAERIVMPKHLPTSMQTVLLESIQSVDVRMVAKLEFVDERLEIWNGVKDVFLPIYDGLQQWYVRHYVNMQALVAHWDDFAPGYSYARIDEVRPTDHLEWQKRPAPFIWTNGMNALRYVLNGFYMLVIAARYGECADADIPNLVRGLQMLQAILQSRSGSWNLQLAELVRVLTQLQPVEVPGLEVKSWMMTRQARQDMFELVEDSRYHEMREELKHVGRRWLRAKALRRIKRILLGIESDPRWRNFVRVGNLLVYAGSLAKTKGVKDLAEIVQSGEPQLTTYDMQPTHETATKLMFEAFGKPADKP